MVLITKSSKIPPPPSHGPEIGYSITNSGQDMVILEGEEIEMGYFGQVRSLKGVILHWFGD